MIEQRHPFVYVSDGVVYEVTLVSNGRHIRTEGPTRIVENHNEPGLGVDERAHRKKLRAICRVCEHFATSGKVAGCGNIYCAADGLDDAQIPDRIDEYRKAIRDNECPLGKFPAQAQEGQ